MKMLQATIQISQYQLQMTQINQNFNSQMAGLMYNASSTTMAIAGLAFDSHGSYTVAQGVRIETFLSITFQVSRIKKLIS
jgi:hypothetical protein